MEKVTDWAALWRELAELRLEKEEPGAGPETDRWRAKARRMHASIKRRWVKPDSSRDFVVAQLDPDATVLDIGAGTGAWAALMARRARKVTAVEQSAAMIEVMQETLAAEAITNVEIVRGSWPDVQVAPHDFTLCSHAMYSSPDLPGFIRRMEAVTRRTCFLLMRATTPDGLMAEAATRVWGHPYDSTSYAIGYNVLLQMGIFANVLMEDTGLWDPWTSASPEEAVDDIKRRLGLDGPSEYDAFLADLVGRRLSYED